MELREVCLVNALAPIPALPPPVNPVPLATPPIATIPPVEPMARLGYPRPMKVPWEISEFDGNDVSSYLRKYNLLAEDCGLVGRIKLSRFTAYCTNAVIPEVEAQPGYDTGNWAEFEISLKKYYFDRDPQQIQCQMPFLRTIAERQHAKGTVDIKAYSLQYKRIVRALIDQEKIFCLCRVFWGIAGISTG